MQKLKGKNYAYVTLLSDNLYVYYMLALYFSWKNTNSKYDFLCIVTNNVSPAVVEILDSAGIPNVIVNTIDIKQQIAKMDDFTKVPVFINAFSKFKVFTATQFDKCVYLDADMLVVKNIDELFEKEPWSAVEDIITETYEDKNTYYTGMTMFNSGMFVFEPSIELYHTFINGLDKLPPLAKKDWMSSHWHDQAILNYHCKDWMQRKELHLPVTYNWLEDWREPILFRDQLFDIKIRHYVGEKRFYIAKKQTDISSILFADWVHYLSFINKIINTLKLPLEPLDINLINPIAGSI